MRKFKEGFTVTETIHGNVEGKGFSKREILAAKLARETQGLIGHPPNAEFKRIVSRNPKTFPFSAVDVRNSDPIFGPSRPRLRGAATRQRPEVVREGRLDIPRNFYKFHKRVTLCADVMFVSGLPFLVTSSRNIKFVTAEFVPNRKAGQLAKHLRKFLKLYA